jgi:hypothetical protein
MQLISTLRPWAALLAAAPLALTLPACGGSDAPSPAPTSSAAPAPAPAPAPSSAPAPAPAAAAVPEALRGTWSAKRADNSVTVLVLDATRHIVTTSAYTADGTASLSEDGKTLLFGGLCGSGTYAWELAGATLKLTASPPGNDRCTFRVRDLEQVFQRVQ